MYYQTISMIFAKGKKTAKVEFYIETEKEGKIRRISYSGDSEGLKDLSKIIKAMK